MLYEVITMLLRCKGRELDLRQPQVMGILNVTPDSFSDGNHYRQKEAALRQAARLCADGASLLDIGGESTRPGAAEVSVQEELDRVMPVVEAVLAELDVMVSVDTSKPEVIQASCAAGIHLVNDIRALRLPGALEAAARITSYNVCYTKLLRRMSTTKSCFPSGVPMIPLGCAKSSITRVSFLWSGAR